LEYNALAQGAGLDALLMAGLVTFKNSRPSAVTPIRWFSAAPQHSPARRSSEPPASHRIRLARR